MTNQDIWRIALQQSAYDCNCEPEDFLADENKVVLSQKHEKARVYLPLPFECDMVSYGSNIVAQVSPRMKETVQWYLDKYPVEHCFESPHVIALNEKLAEFGYKVCFMAEYFLPDLDVLRNCPVIMNCVCCIRRILCGIIRIPGAMPCAKAECIWTCWQSVPMTMGS